MNHKLNEAMDHISDAFIADAAAQVNKARGAAVPLAPRPQPWLGAVAAVLIIVLIGAILFPIFNALDPNGTTNPPVLQSPTTVEPTTGTTRPTAVDDPTSSSQTRPTTAPTARPNTSPSINPTTSPTIIPNTTPTTHPTINNPCANGHTFEDGCCCICGIPVACYHGMHSYENGFCKYCQVEEPFDKDARLIVNGKDITADNYVKINIRYGNGSVPLTAVLTELGIPWEWESSTKLRIGTGELARVLDTTLPSYAWLIPPGTQGGVRMVMDGEIIIDIQSLYVGYLRSQGITCEIDCATKTIRIDTPA